MSNGFQKMGVISLLCSDLLFLLFYHLSFAYMDQIAEDGKKGLNGSLNSFFLEACSLDYNNIQISKSIAQKLTFKCKIFNPINNLSFSLSSKKIQSINNHYFYLKYKALSNQLFYK